MIFILILIANISCKKTKKLTTIPPIVVKSEFIIDENILFDLTSYFDTVSLILEGNYQFVSDTKCIYYANFNPNNPFEIVYYKYSNSFSGEVDVNIYNRNTKISQFLVSDKVYNTPVWGRNNWILYSNGYIHAIKSNGDSSIKLTSGGVFHPQWNYDGSRFYFKSPMNNISTFYNFYTNTIDSIPFEINRPCSWDNSVNLIAHTSEINGVEKNFILDMNTLSQREILLPLKGSFKSWLNNDECLFLSDYENNIDNANKIFICNFNTKKLTKVISLANAYAMHMSYNSVSNELLIVFRILEQLSEEVLKLSSKTLILNMNNNTVSELVI